MSDNLDQKIADKKNELKKLDNEIKARSTKKTELYHDIVRRNKRIKFKKSDLSKVLLRIS